MAIEMWEKPRGKLYEAKHIRKLAAKLGVVFRWSSTEEGAAYWNDVQLKLFALAKQVEKEQENG